MTSGAVAEPKHLIFRFPDCARNDIKEKIQLKPMLLHERLKDKHLILASASPRRRQLLADTGLTFDVADKFPCDETWPDELPAAKVAPYLSQLKSRAYPRPLADNDILITADTVVMIDGCVLGKPAGRDDALQMLGRLSGRTHTVVTGVTLRSATRSRTFSADSAVTFRRLTDEELAYYVDTFRPYDKAGAYGIQEWIGCVAVERIEGSFYNVMGLPVQRLYVELGKFLQK